MQAEEIGNLDQYLNKLAENIPKTLLEKLPPVVAFRPSNDLPDPSPKLKGVRIAVASDIAFSFVYHANLNLLQAMGAELKFFSPLADKALPEVDSLYLPGGYPELHVEELEANHSIRAAIQNHHTAGKPIVAECGGMLYLLTTLTNQHGQQANLVNILPGHATMQKRLTNLGFHTTTFPDGELRGHTFHHSQMKTSVKPSAHSQPARKGLQPESLFCLGRLTASYMHWYMPSNPNVTAALFSP